jgi:hypothetical protein
VENQGVAGAGPRGRLENSGQLLLDDFGILARRDANPVGDPENVSVDREPRDA